MESNKDDKTSLVHSDHFKLNFSILICTSIKLSVNNKLAHCSHKWARDHKSARFWSNRHAEIGMVFVVKRHVITNRYVTRPGYCSRAAAAQWCLGDRFRYRGNAGRITLGERCLVVRTGKSFLNFPQATHHLVATVALSQHTPQHSMSPGSSPFPSPYSTAYLYTRHTNTHIYWPIDITQLILMFCIPIPHRRGSNSF